MCNLINNLEQVLYQAARFVKWYHHRISGVTKMLKDLGRTNVADRSRDLRMALLFRIVKGKVTVPADTVSLKE